MSADNKRQHQIYALERCIRGREDAADRMDEESGDPWASLGYREDTEQLRSLHAELEFDLAQKAGVQQ